MVLDDVPDDADLLIERAAGLDADVLGHRDLDVVDEARVPDRLEEGVAEAEIEDVLDGLLGQVMVDAEDLLLVEGGQDLPVEGLRGLEVLPERLFDDELGLRQGPAKPELVEPRHDEGNGLGRNGQIKDDVDVPRRPGRGKRGQPLPERPVQGVLAGLAVEIVEPAGERGDALRRPDYDRMARDYETVVDQIKRYASSRISNLNNLIAEWKTVVAGGLRQGGNSYYALDVTDPTSASYPSYLWEFPQEGASTALTSTMGQTWGQPIITKVKVVIGGAPIDQNFCDLIKADGYAPDAPQGVQLCKKWIS